MAQKKAPKARAGNGGTITHVVDESDPPTIDAAQTVEHIRAELDRLAAMAALAYQAGASVEARRLSIALGALADGSPDLLKAWADAAAKAERANGQHVATSRDARIEAARALAARIGAWENPRERAETFVTHVRRVPELRALTGARHAEHSGKQVEAVEEALSDKHGHGAEAMVRAGLRAMGCSVRDADRLFDADRKKRRR